MRVLLAVVIALTLGACSGVGSDQQTLVAFDQSMATNRAVLAATSTADMEQLLATLDTSGTRVGRAAELRGRIISTMNARGTEVNFDMLSATPPPQPTRSVAQSNLTPTLPGQLGTNDGVRPTDVPVTPLVPTIPPTRALPTIDTSITADNLSDVVIATNVGDDDCATEITSRFTTLAERVYIVARAFDISPGTQLTSLWERVSGEQLASFSFTPDFSIDDECVWFFATPEDFAFTPGTYTVTLLVNGETASARIPFEITLPVTPVVQTPTTAGS